MASCEMVLNMADADAGRLPSSVPAIPARP
jgi:hypothetical protein